MSIEERAHFSYVLLMSMPWILTGMIVLYARWLWGLMRDLAPGKKYRNIREQGKLDQRTSQPYLDRDGGRGPTGGRLLVPRADHNSNTLVAIICWLLVAVCLGCSLFLYLGRLGEWVPVWLLATVFFMIIAIQAAPHLMSHQQNRVEVSPFPPAVGDQIQLRIHNNGVGAALPWRVRLCLIERVKQSHGATSGWSEEVLWEEPFQEADVPRSMPILYARTLRIPGHLPGTYLAPGYRLEWIIEVTPDAIEPSPRAYPLPVVQ